MAKTPVVTIRTGINIDQFYEQILAQIDAKYHNYQTTFTRHPTSEAEYGDLESMANHAQHASDGLIIKGHMASTDGGTTWTHIERLLR